MSDLKGGYTLSLITPNDADAVIQFVTKNFFKDEPISKYLNKERSDRTISHQWTRYCIKGDCSFKATTNTGSIVGICLNTILNRFEEPNSVVVPSNRIVDLLESCKKMINLFEKYPDAKCLLEGSMLSVDRNCRRTGIGKAFAQKTTDYCLENNIPYCFALCTSYYSIKMARAMGYREIFSMKFKDYLVDGVAFFNLAKPHTEIVGFIKKL